MIAYLIDQRSQLFLKTFSIIVSSTWKKKVESESVTHSVVSYSLRTHEL